MLFAVPSTLLMAESILVVFKSWIFSSAISLIWARVMVPTTSLGGVAAPFLILIFCLINSDTGGSLVTKVKVLSS